jgi:hypothetical protein
VASFFALDLEPEALEQEGLESLDIFFAPLPNSDCFISESFNLSIFVGD